MELVIALLCGSVLVTAQVKYDRQDYYVRSEKNINIHVRKITVSTAKARSAILLLHGGSGAGVASFDVAVPGYSLAEDLAKAGYAVYLMDARGYGDSTKPPDLDDPSPTARSSVTAGNVAKDIDAVIDDILRKQKVKKVALFGWASGGHWLGYYAAKHNKKVNRLILLNTIYGVNAPWGLRNYFEAQGNPGVYRENPGSLRVATAENLLASWDRTIPIENKDLWRDPRVADFYAKTTLESESDDKKTKPATVRLPNGFQEEAFEMSLGRKLFDAAEIKVPTLVIRGELDHWSRPEDLTALEADLKNAPVKKVLTIRNATHFLFIDRPERGRDIFLKEVLVFLPTEDGCCGLRVSVAVAQ
ncbi:MAG: hypothetical protein JFAIHJKO_02388 [Pyrinomonadaceae bacterium]|nr:hypothetical protein [Pyrinomonadaceae bacterium]